METEISRRVHDPGPDWLERLDRGEVVVNLRPETDPETEYVVFDRICVLRVPARIITDLDEPAGTRREPNQRQEPRSPTSPSPAFVGRARPTAKADDRPGSTDGPMGGAGATISQVKKASTASGRIGIRLSPSRDGLEKGPLNETLRSQWRKNERPRTPFMLRRPREPQAVSGAVFLGLARPTVTNFLG